MVVTSRQKARDARRGPHATPPPLRPQEPSTRGPPAQRAREDPRAPLPTACPTGPRAQGAGPQDEGEPGRPSPGKEAAKEARRGTTRQGRQPSTEKCPGPEAPRADERKREKDRKKDKKQARSPEGATHTPGQGDEGLAPAPAAAAAGGGCGPESFMSACNDHSPKKARRCAEKSWDAARTKEAGPESPTTPKQQRVFD